MPNGGSAIAVAVLGIVRGAINVRQVFVIDVPARCRPTLLRRGADYIGLGGSTPLVFILRP